MFRQVTPCMHVHVMASHYVLQNISYTTVNGNDPGEDVHDQRRDR